MVDGQVTLGSTVTVTVEGMAKPRTMKIVGSQEADAMNGIISEDSPFGKALLGSMEGETVIVHAPNGDKKCHVDKIER